VFVAEPNVDFVLFDLGGVLVELGDLSELQAMTRYGGSQDSWQQILQPWIWRFETGECSASEFATGVVTGLEVDITPEQCLDVFRDWAIGPYPGTDEVLWEVQQAVEIGCLSNTNVMHWQDQSTRWPVLTTFNHRFLSFEVGLRKPDPRIYQAVADRLPYHRDRILFLDDLAVNADAAREFGFRAERVRGLGEVATVLREVGLLGGGHE
jgi:glucose-1-phosphatase